MLQGVPRHPGINKLEYDDCKHEKEDGACGIDRKEKNNKNKAKNNSIKNKLKRPPHCSDQMKVTIVCMTRRQNC